MSIFEYISVAISIILALGITRLLTGMIDLVRYRRAIKWHWIPLVWALAILIIQFQFWWQVFAIDGVLESLERGWRNVDYVVMVLYTVTLFIAGSLVLPTRYEPGKTLDLWAHFQSEGKLALIALLGYVACGVLLVVVVLEAPILSMNVLVAVVLGVVWGMPMLGILLSEGKKAATIWTTVFAVIGVAIWVLTVIPQHASGK